MAMKLGDTGGEFADVNMTVDRRDVGVTHHLHHFSAARDARGEDRQSSAAATQSAATAAAGSGQSRHRLRWDIDVERGAVDRKTMQGYISEQAGEDPQPEVHISVDKFAKYEKVAQTLADLQSRGLKKIGFVNNDLF